MVTRAALTLVAAALLAPGAGTAWAAKPKPKPKSVAITLSVDQASPEAGDQVALTARARRLPGGYLIVLRVTDPDGVQVIETCKTAVCPSVWTEATAATATFQAFVRTKAHGGKIVGRTAPLQVGWHAAAAPPPPPPPAAAALAGHYCGLSNEGKSICFDVTPAQAPQVVENLVTESLVTCGDGTEWLWRLPYSEPVSILTPGLKYAYTFAGSRPDIPGASNIVMSYTITGTFDAAGNISGTIQLVHAAWDDGGTHYDCAGDPRTWNARLGA